VAAILPWRLWNSCNIKLWEASAFRNLSHSHRLERRIPSTSGVVCKGLNLKQNLNHQITWMKPTTCVLKCNVDATTFNNNTIVGYGVCFWNSMGHFILGKSTHLPLYGSVLKAEVFAMLDSIHTTISTGLHSVVFEI